MASILSKTFYGNTIEQWAFALGIVLGVVIFGKIAYWISSNILKELTKRTKTKLDDIILDMIEEPIIFALMIAGAGFGIFTLNLSEGAKTWLWNVVQVLIVFNVAWMLARLFDAIYKEYLVPLAEKTDTDLDDQLLPIISKGVKAIIWIVAIIVALNNAGYNVGALLAGLGIGGIALAMAAKDTIANIFGGFTIFTDKPFKLKDRIKISGFDGTVKEIGIRSTRLQTLAGRIVTIPNSTFAENPVENVSMEPSRKVVLNIGLTYDTTHTQMQRAMKILSSIAKKSGAMKKDPLISFNAFNDSSMNILFIYYIKKGANILDTFTYINMEILKQFNKEKLDFAFPTQTIYTKKG